MTNAEKFKEVFGFTHSNECPFDTDSCMGCKYRKEDGQPTMRCDGNEFWEDEFGSEVWYVD